MRPRGLRRRAQPRQAAGARLTARRLPIALLGAALVAVATVAATLAAADHARVAAHREQRELVDRAVVMLHTSVNTSAQRLGDLAAAVGAAPRRRAGRVFTLIGERMLGSGRLAALWRLEPARAPDGRRVVVREALGRHSWPPAGTTLTGMRALADALRAAVAAGVPRTTAPVDVPGFAGETIVLVHPVYRGGAVPATLAARRRAVRGWTAGIVPVAYVERVQRLLFPGAPALEIRVGGHALVSWARPVGDGALARAFDAVGTRWEVAVAPVVPDYGLAWTIGGAGSALVLALALIAGQTIRRERYALALVAERMAERDRAEAELRASLARTAAAEQRFRTAFEAAPIGMVLADLDGRVLQVNDALCAITGYTRDELEELRLDELSHPADVARERELMDSLLVGDQTTYWLEKRYVDVVGQVVWVSVHATLVRGPDGRPQHFLGQIQDISERIRYEAQLQHMADHDPLTGLLNRRAFERELNQHVAHVRRHGPAGAVIVLDIDRFKHINDTLGHRAGDELVVTVAQSLRTRLRDSDVLARLGGDEFALLLRTGGEAQVRAVADKVLAAVRAQSVPTGGGRRRPITASVGVALFDGDGSASAEDVLVNADLAMYDAKEAGRDRYAIFPARDRGVSRMKARITWAERIREALEEERFALYAQPIVELATGAVRQHELLLRMVDERGEVIPPASFVGVAERFDLMQEIDRWVVTQAIRHLGRQRRAGHELVLEVNVCGSSIGDPALLELIERELGAAGVEPARLVLEVTETTAVGNIPRAQQFAARLAQLGCRFALDDFGAGFGSFSYLKHLPFDILKIDGEFVRSCTTSSTDQLLIQAAVQIARGMGKQTIAEEVGDEETVALLRSLGVDYAQGFHIGRPRPLQEHAAHGSLLS